MLKRYRRQFILLNMCLVGAVLALMLILVGVYMYHDYYDGLRTTMREVVRPLDPSMFTDAGLTPPPRRGASERFPDEMAGPGGQDTETPPPSPARRKGISTIFYTQDGQISVLSDDPIFDADTLAAAIPAIIRQDKDFGVLGEYGVIYYRSGGGRTYKIAVTSTSYLRDSMADLTLILAGVFIASMVLFYCISRGISLLAIRPLEKAMTREKQFVADASHDLKTPLTVILANISILQGNPQATAAEQKKWIDGAAAAARNLQAMVNSLLTLSGVEDLKSTVELEEVNLSDVVEQAVLQMESVAYDSGIELKSDVEPDLRIRGNRDYALQVVSNLIENALKYEPMQGSVSVRLCPGRGKAILTVANPNGLIAAEDLPHIFERFYRADKARDARYGHGLGLAIARRMTEAMGGTISAASSEREGTRFTVTYKLL